jgi:formamidopyrimidine-DNA glycosylase
MPELPEVETVRCGLEPRLLGSRLERVEVREPRLRERVDAGALRQLIGCDVQAVRRRAKYLIIDTSADKSLVIHLGMSGHLAWSAPTCVLRSHDHVSLWWSTHLPHVSTELRYNDPRRFGLMLVIPEAGMERHRLFARLGPDPFAAGFTAEHLHTVSRGSKRPVKNMLMDARVVTGIGNIYASEALWLARIHPATACRRIAAPRWSRLHTACLDVLNAALQQGGTTLNDFRDVEGSRGYFAVRLQVYSRAGRECRRCAATVRRVVQAGRSTYYCPGCQS